MNLLIFPAKLRNYAGLGAVLALIFLLGACSSTPSTTADQGSLDAAKEKADEAKTMAENLNAAKLFPDQFSMGEKDYTVGVGLGDDGNFQGGTDSFISAEQFYMESYEMAKKAKEEAEMAIKQLTDSIKETEAAAEKAAQSAGA